MADEEDDFYQTGKASKSEEGAEDAGQETALLPKSMFQGKPLEPGTKCEIKIESVMGDEVEVSYVPHEKKEEKKEEKEESTDAAIDRSIENMRGM